MQGVLEEAAPAQGALRMARERAISLLSGRGFPTTNVEEFRFCDLSPLHEGKAPKPCPRPGEIPFDLPDALEGYEQIIIADGHVVLGSNGGQDSLQGTGASLERGNELHLMNAAFASEAVSLSVPEGQERSVHIVYAGVEGEEDGAATRPLRAPRVHVECGKGAKMRIVEEFVGSEGRAGGATFSVLEASLAEGAEMEHTMAQRDVHGSYVARGTFIDQEEGSVYRLGEMGLGASLARHDLSIDTKGPNTETMLRAIYLTGENQLHDLHSKLWINHEEAKGDQLHKSIATSPTSRSVFDGNIRVASEGQDADAAQLTRNLLLAPKASINTRPNLQISADNVACAHGCTVSDLSEEALFYFRSRGIDESLARSSLVSAFAMEVVDQFPLAHSHSARLLESSLAGTAS